MIFHNNDKIVVRIPGTILQFGDIAIIKDVNHYSDKQYFCFDALRQTGEWMKERWLDKYMERPPKKMIPERIKFYATQKDGQEEQKKELVRPKSEYTNLPSPMNIYSDMKKEENKKDD